MKNLILMFFVIGTVMIFFSCQEESILTPELSQGNQQYTTLAKPAAKLVGATYTDFIPANDPYYWSGTIDFGDGDEYGLAFESFGFPTDHGQSSHFDEAFIIFKLGGSWTDPEDIYLKGLNSGVVSNVNSKFRANGEVTEAYGPFDGWTGRKVHISGVVVWNEDGSAAAIGTFRIN